ncbi:MAG: acyltransferase [Ramlibacter sp.]|jgi:peptidoglycan/LPS O-acetylase OafA/YrhL|nr:acyltransferase [Ramlibacter sp.]
MDHGRFDALDSWRGVAACMVALSHFAVASHVVGSAFVNGSYLFVDFFFVLSGFVIAANYHQRLLEGFGLTRFMLLRWGRLYPLHVAVLCAYIGYKMLQLAVPSLASPSAPPFSTPDDSLGALGINLLLMQGLGIYDFPNWNVPSWSISAEFFAYLVFAALLTTLRKRLWIALAAAVVLGPVILALFSHTYMDAAYDLGFVRCLYGFAAGVLCWHAHKRWTLKSGTLLELVALAAVVAFISTTAYSVASYAAPYLFAGVVVVYARQAGAVSRLLQHRAFLLLGMLSYSIYMVHWFVVGRIYSVAKLAKVNLLAINPWIGDLLFIAFMSVVVGISCLTFRFVEQPGRRWSRQLAERLDAPPAVTRFQPDREQP